MFAVSNFDFRGEAKRDKSLDISKSRFNTSNFIPERQRVEVAEKYAAEKFFHEKYSKEEEEHN